MLDERVNTAVERGVRYLEARLLPRGELPVFTCDRPDMTGEQVADPSVFPTALAACCLSIVPGAEKLRARMGAFLLAQRDASGLWRHWPQTHPLAAGLPADVDDTANASLALARIGADADVPRRLLLANRDGQGRFLTWFTPRFDRTALRMPGLMLANLRHAPTLILFFRRWTASPDDVDAVVNANALVALGDFPGRGRVVAFLLDVLDKGELTTCDKWYDDPFVVLYFLARALSGEAEARPLICREHARLVPMAPLHDALGASCRYFAGEEPDEESMDRLVATQQPDGSWPAASVYHGGRPRHADGSLGPKRPGTPHWGSDELSTAFCLEALSRWRAAHL